jgi:hypothetical protein
MNLFNKLRHALLGRPQPKVTRLAGAETGALRIDELPPFNLHVAELMRYDPQVRIGLGARNGLLMSAEVEVIGDDRQIDRWVQHQFDALWHSAAHQLLRAKLFGFLPFEVVYRRAASGPFRGLIEVERLIDYHPRGARLLVEEDKIVGFSYEPAKYSESSQSARVGERESMREYGVTDPHTLAHAHSGTINLFAPQALVCTFDAECANPYGCALLARAYPAWYEKWMPGGAKRTLRLRMIKDAYIGDIFWYPPDRRFELPDGREITYRELAREIVESRHSGGALTLPLVYDSAGNKLVDYTPPQGVSGYTQVFRWKSDLDLEIWKALEVPPEVIQASNSGSGYSGRWIPFAVALSAVHQELAELVRCIDRDILRPLAQLNFGREAQYDIHPKSLVEKYARMFSTQRAPSNRERMPLSAAAMDEEEDPIRK